MKTVLIFIMLFMAVSAFAQNPAVGGVEMADTFRSEGKIYVVIAVVVTILLGIGYYLWLLDRRLSRLEKERRERKKGK